MKVKLRRNKHNLSHYKLGTCFPGELVPVGLVEVCPGDTFDHRMGAFLRMLPMNAPLIHRAQVRLHAFFTPFRILWPGATDTDSWEAFITRAEPGVTDAVPSDTLANVLSTAGSQRLAEYLGIPVTPESQSSTSLVSLLPFACYNMIYNEWYRDQDLVTALVQDAGEIDVATDCDVRRVSWQKDYFTAARPWPQKGPDITLPLGVSAPVISTGVAPNFIRDDSTGIQVEMSMNDTTNANDWTNVPGGTGATSAMFGDETGLEADLTNATSVDVNAVRRAFSLQRLAERLAQFGSRYPELLASMGVKSSDARLSRPEYLGGGKVPINFSEVLQTADAATTQVGEMRGHAIAPGGTRPYRKFFEEHGYVMVMMSIRPQTVYSTALPRMFSHGLIDAQNDFYTPELERIGQQEIYNREIFPDATGDDTVWGYGPRYDQYRHHPSQVSGLLAVGQSLDYWTWARGFSTLPALNQTFTDCNPDGRVFFDTAGAPVIFGVNHHLIAQRMLTRNIIGRIM